MEKDFIQSGHPQLKTVISCGGGLVVQPGMADILRAKGIVVCLHASIETILERTSRSSTRPLLAVEDPEKRVRLLYTQREPFYKESGTVVLTDQKPIKEIVAHVVRIWERESFEFARSRS
jgi:shikimate kinase